MGLRWMDREFGTGCSRDVGVVGVEVKMLVGAAMICGFLISKQMLERVI